MGDYLDVDARGRFRGEVRGIDTPVVRRAEAPNPIDDGGFKGRGGVFLSLTW
jgi:hypothetical protein